MVGTKIEMFVFPVPLGNPAAMKYLRPSGEVKLRTAQCEASEVESRWPHAEARRRPTERFDNIAFPPNCEPNDQTRSSSVKCATTIFSGLHGQETSGVPAGRGQPTE